MLKKLYAYEYRSLFRSLLPIYIGLLGLALIGRLPYLFDREGIAVALITGLSTAFYILGIAALFIVGAVIIVTRFYKNLLGGEGYLTFTLPFTPTQHIVCKLLCAVSLMLVNALVVFASLLITGAGSDVLDGIFSLIKAISGQFSAFRIISIVAEAVLYIVASFFQGVLMFYAAMAIGQQFRSRIGGAVLAYICMYVAIEIIQFTGSMILMFGFADQVEAFLSEGVASIQIAMLLPIAEAILISVACFVATRHFLTKRLNLE